MNRVNLARVRELIVLAKLKTECTQKLHAQASLAEYAEAMADEIERFRQLSAELIGELSKL